MASSCVVWLFELKEAEEGRRSGASLTRKTMLWGFKNIYIFVGEFV